MLYELLTENKNKQKIQDLTSKYFEGYNIQNITGSWQGILEKSIKISIIAENTAAINNKIKDLAAAIKVLNNQEAILINKIDNEYLLI